MGYSGERHYVNKEIGQSLSVVLSGLTKCEAGHRTAPTIHRVYSIHFVLEGKGTYYVNGKAYPVERGQGFIIFPNHTVYYQADVKEPWEYIYGDFCGLDDKNIVYYAGLDEENVVFSFEISDEIQKNLYAMYNACSNTKAYGYEATGYFLVVMSKLIESHSVHTKAKYISEHYIRRAVLYVESSDLQDISVTEMAKYVGIDRTYLYKIFKECLGTTPQKYLTEYRLERAKYMLQYTDLAIGEIAMEAGFYDSSHFVKRFIKRYDISPLKYRERCIRNS